MNRVCFIAPLARPLIEPTFQCDFGGAEVRALNFARGLARRRDFKVDFVLRSYQNEDPRQIGELTAHFEKATAPIARVRDLPRDHTFLWKLAEIQFRKLQRKVEKKRQPDEPEEPKTLPFFSDLPADVLCVMGVHHYAANVVQSGRASGKRSVLFLASETDLDERYNEDSVNDYRQKSHMCRFALQNADLIVAQTERQQSLLAERFARDSTVIGNPIDLSLDNKSEEPPIQGDYILWVGRADTFSKRADKFFEIARRCSDVQFVGVMNRRDRGTFEKLMASVPSNVRIVEHVPFSQVENYFAHADALLNTSDAEGFPNAFLQAGKYGVPILSLTVDPNKMLSRHECGLLGTGDIATMARLLQQMWDQRKHTYRDLYSKNVSRYVEEHHSLDDRLDELQAVLERLLHDAESTRSTSPRAA